jgi:hypothetical protein
MTPVFEPYSHFVPIPPQYQPHYPQQVYYPPAPAPAQYPQPHRWSRGARRAVGWFMLLVTVGLGWVLFLAILVTLAADKGCDCAEFVKDLRRACVTPHVAQKVRTR